MLPKGSFRDGGDRRGGPKANAVLKNQKAQPNFPVAADIRDLMCYVMGGVSIQQDPFVNRAILWVSLCDQMEKILLSCSVLHRMI